ncbi:flagellar basal body-associated FliL family protein [Methylobrevis albus]|uniref:Flagellar protein FliL n=1 Tax=Methylobrevis albus TaxID=2793297 RepID=A0A931I0R9_9HYPH|nr:flagellar basal body-associated FliL family protein [Methylobrevis albus]MBH0236871.1 flagellar basal body-associated FliL family protein [Methylobrevis albus]
MAKKPKSADGAAEEGEAPAGGGKKKLLILGGAGVAVLLLVGGGAFFMLSGGEEEVAGATSGPPPPPPIYYLDLPEMVVNLSTADQRASFVKLSVSLEVPEQTMIAQIEPNLPRVLDAFQTYLRELRVTDLQGSAGLFRMKEELQRRINLAVYPARVDDVLFRNILVQ